MLSKFISRINFQTKSSFSNMTLNLFKKQIRCFSDVQATKRTHGGLKDQDRIFTNVYRDGDPFIEGAIKRVIWIIYLYFIKYILKQYFFSLTTLQISKNYQKYYLTIIDNNLFFISY